MRSSWRARPVYPPMMEDRMMNKLLSTYDLMRPPFGKDILSAALLCSLRIEKESTTCTKNHSPTRRVLLRCSNVSHTFGSGPEIPPRSASALSS